MDKNACAPTSPMGWNSWDCYGAAVNEDAVRGNADYMATHLKDFGWQYVVVDIQWSEPTADGWDYHPFAELCMDEYSRVIPAPNRFPSSAGGKGFKPLSDYVHSLGLKFGIHIMRGIPRQAVHRNTAILGSDRTARQIAKRYSLCPWNTDMYGVDARQDGAQAYYDSLFALYASWDVDYVKVDDIANTEFDKQNPYSAADEIEMIRRAIDRCGRPMVLSLSPGPAPVSHAAHLCLNANLWRMTGDFWDHWDKLYDMFDRCEQWAPYVGDGCWPDCDMLPLGYILAGSEKDAHYTNFTRPEQYTMMTLWSIFHSPLMMGGEMRRNDDFTLSLMTNREVLYVHAHSFAARRVKRVGHEIVWTASGEDGRLFVALFNVGEAEREVALALSDITNRRVASAKELWTGEAVDIQDSIRRSLPPHGAALVALTLA